MFLEFIYKTYYYLVEVHRFPALFKNTDSFNYQIHISGALFFKAKAFREFLGTCVEKKVKITFENYAV